MHLVFTDATANLFIAFSPVLHSNSLISSCYRVIYAYFVHFPKIP